MAQEAEVREPEQTPEPAEASEGQEVAIEIEKPKGRPAMSDEELAKHANVPEDEIGKYADEAQKRIKGLRNAYQEQRRRAEQWSRDASTASNLAEQLYRENQSLKQNVTRSENALIEQALGRAEAQLEQARIKARQAQASGDSDLIVAANEDVARAVAEVDRYKLLKPTAGAPTEAAPPPPPQPAQPQQPQVSERTRSFIAANPWFGKDDQMTQFALRTHHHLAVDGITEDGNPDLYWRTIESKLKEQYPDKFGGSARQPTESRARPVAVTGGTRSNGGATPPAGKQQAVVHLTDSQVRLAKRLGLTLEQYAKQYAEDEKEAQKEGRVQ